MAVIKFILRLIGLLVTIVIQMAVSLYIIFSLFLLFPGIDTTSRLGWLVVILVIFLCYLIGINLVGYFALRWVWRNIPLLAAQRFLGSLIGALIPLLILIPIGFSVPVEGTHFYELVTNKWQPILAQASLFAAILGYYSPGIFKRRG